MPRVKLTKTELKAQKDALARYRRFLPMLQLKKSQLQSELGSIRAREAELAAQEKAVLDGSRPWAGLLAASDAPPPVRLKRVRSHAGNIAGVAIPVFDGVDVERERIDLWATPEYFDDAADAAGRLLAARAEREIAAEQVRLVAAELRTTSQRVNLFEKVKIPECLENIRVINVAIGDEQTSSVVRGKIAKGRQAKLIPEAESAPEENP